MDLSSNIVKFFILLSDEQKEEIFPILNNIYNASKENSNESNKLNKSNKLNESKISNISDKIRQYYFK